MHQSLTGSSIYSSGRAPQRTTTTRSTPIVCMILIRLCYRVYYGFITNGKVLFRVNEQFSHLLSNHVLRLNFREPRK